MYEILPKVEGVGEKVYGYGLCECGCGRQTRISPKTDSKSGLVKGQPRHFVFPHRKGRRERLEYVVEDRGCETPCWIWQGSVGHMGHAQFKDKGKTVRPHRFLFEQKYGPIPDGLFFDHLCRVTSCVNPDHGEIVSCAENTRRGDVATITWSCAQEIRELLRNSGLTQRQIARIYGLAQSSISRIATGASWKQGVGQ